MADLFKSHGQKRQAPQLVYDWFQKFIKVNADRLVF